jgi:hypothetical protein
MRCVVDGIVRRALVAAVVVLALLATWSSRGLRELTTLKIDKAAVSGAATDSAANAYNSTVLTAAASSASALPAAAVSSWTPFAPGTPTPPTCWGVPAGAPLPAGCRRVIATSMYGNRTRYTSMIVPYARSLAALAPEWEYWVYIDPARLPPTEVLSALHDAGAVLKERTNLSSNGMIWRFMAGDDPSVARFAVRDADARFTLRELWSLRAWEDSGLPFHAQRDHPAHFSMSLPLGGMWGATTGLLPHMATLLSGPKAMAMKANNKTHYGADMEFLHGVVTPLMLSSGVLEHLPTVHCLKHLNGRSHANRRPLPFPRAGFEFLGSAGVAEGDMHVLRHLREATNCTEDGVPAWNRSQRAVTRLMDGSRDGGSGSNIHRLVLEDAVELAARAAAVLACRTTGCAVPPLGALDVALQADVTASAGGGKALQIHVAAIRDAFVTVTAIDVPTAATPALKPSRSAPPALPPLGASRRRGAVHHYRGLLPLTLIPASATPSPVELEAVPFFHELFPLQGHPRVPYDAPNMFVVPRAVVLLVRSVVSEAQRSDDGNGTDLQVDASVTASVTQLLQGLRADADAQRLGRSNNGTTCLLVLWEPVIAQPQYMNASLGAAAGPGARQRQRRLEPAATSSGSRGGLEVCASGAAPSGKGAAASAHAAVARRCWLRNDFGLPPCLGHPSALRVVDPPRSPLDPLRQELTWYARDLLLVAAAAADAVLPV